MLWRRIATWLGLQPPAPTPRKRPPGVPWGARFDGGIHCWVDPDTGFIYITEEGAEYGGPVSYPPGAIVTEMRDETYIFRRRPQTPHTVIHENDRALPPAPEPEALPAPFTPPQRRLRTGRNR